MTKKVILNVVLNLGIILLILSGVAAYRSGHVLFLGLSIALVIVLIYLKMVLLKYVKREVEEKAREKVAKSSSSMVTQRGKKTRAKNKGSL